mgnify:CR=1 FL=1
MYRTIATIVLALALTGCGMVPEQRRQPSRTATQTYSPSPSARQCLAELGKSNASFTPLPDQYFGGGCSTLNTVRLSAIYGDEKHLQVANLGPVACPLANTFAAWARYGVDRAARQILGSGLARIETMGSYSCRNVAGTGRLSAHATANAIDIGAFILEDGRRISLINGWSNGTRQERQFLRVVHASACKRFGTVLGPDYNSAHRDHFHLETSGRSFCR